MPENTEVGTEIVQENSEKSENNQPKTELNTEVEDNSSESQEDHEDSGEKDESDDLGLDDLPLPDPDLPQDDTKKKKEQPEWMKRKLERERRKEAERLSAEEAEKARLREENERLRAQTQPQNPNPADPAFDPYMPRRDQFKTEGEYFLALGDYRDARRQAEFHQRERVKQIQEHEQRFQNALKDTVAEGVTKYKDFEEKTDFILYGEGFPSNRGMAEAIVDSKYRDDILYFLGSNEKEAVRIANLNPIAAAKAIAKIEGRFEAKRKSNIPKAPNPLNPVSGGKGSATHKDPNKMSMDEFRNWYQSQYG